MMGLESFEIFDNLRVGEKEKKGDGDEGGILN